MGQVFKNKAQSRGGAMNLARACRDGFIRRKGRGFKSKWSL